MEAVPRCDGPLTRLPTDKPLHFCTVCKKSVYGYNHLKSDPLMDLAAIISQDGWFQRGKALPNGPKGLRKA